MNVERELWTLDQAWRHATLYNEFWARYEQSDWGPRIRETVVAGIRRGEAQRIEDAVVFLEVSPRYFRSGYYRAWIVRALKSARLSPDQRRRLRRVILRDVESKKVGPEFIEMARLAVVVADADFLQRIAGRCRQLDGWTRKRCEQVLECCARHASPQQRGDSSQNGGSSLGTTRD